MPLLTFKKSKAHLEHHNLVIQVCVLQTQRCFPKELFTKCSFCTLDGTYFNIEKHIRAAQKVEFFLTLV